MHRSECLGVSLQNTLPTFFVAFPLLRQILLRENIEIVHCHQATSVMTHESLHIARTMGYKTVYTDHSLWGFADFSSVHGASFAFSCCTILSIDGAKV